MAANGLPFARPAAGGLLVRLRVTPKARRNAIAGDCAEADGGRALKVTVTAPADGGQANAAVIKLLAKAWGVPKGAIEIRAGTASRRKTLFVAGEGQDLIRRMSTEGGRSKP